jgi:ElaA protein
MTYGQVATGRRESSALTWTVQRFSELSLQTLYDLLALRSQVFVVEQACVFQDMDGYDNQAVHVLGWEPHVAAPPQAGATLVACARCFAPGVKMPEASIGRVATSASARGKGYGHQLIRQSLAAVHHHWGSQPIRIGAQMRLANFYAGYGFVATGQPYREDGIEHLEMLRPAP